MKHIFETGLIGGVILAVLAFGGTEAPYFAVVQLTFLGLGILLIANSKSMFMRDRKLPVLIPLLLAVFVFVQWVQLPGMKNFSAMASPNSISIAP